MYRITGFVRLAPLLALSLLAISLAASAQQPGRPGRRRGPQVRTSLVPFALVKKTAGFDAIMPNMANFNEMQALRAMLTSAVVPGLKTPTPALQLNYGYKKGGVGVVYEMPSQPGLKAGDVFDGLVKSGVFRERQYFKGWSMKAVPDKKLFIAVSGTTPEVRDMLIKAIGK